MDLFSPMLVTKAVVTRSGATCHKSPVRPSCSQTRNDERSCPDNIHRTSQLLTAGYCLPKHLNGKGETSGEFDVKPKFFWHPHCVWSTTLCCSGVCIEQKRPCRLHLHMNAPTVPAVHAVSGGGSGAAVCIVTAAPGDSQPGPGPANGGGFN